MSFANEGGVELWKFACKIRHGFCMWFPLAVCPILGGKSSELSVAFFARMSASRGFLVQRLDVSEWIWFGLGFRK